MEKKNGGIIIVYVCSSVPASFLSESQPSLGQQVSFLGKELVQIWK